MKDPMEPIDLRESALLGIEHICNSVDRERTAVRTSALT